MVWTEKITSSTITTNSSNWVHKASWVAGFVEGRGFRVYGLGFVCGVVGPFRV
jgi:hypothetical protein